MISRIAGTFIALILLSSLVSADDQTDLNRQSLIISEKAKIGGPIKMPILDANSQNTNSGRATIKSITYPSEDNSLESTDSNSDDSTWESRGHDPNAVIEEEIPEDSVNDPTKDYYDPGEYSLYEGPERSSGEVVRTPKEPETIQQPYIENKDILESPRVLQNTNNAPPNRPIPQTLAEEKAVQATGAQKVSAVSIQEGSKPIYIVETKRTGRIFGVLPMEITSTTKIDAQTAEVLEVEKPWWGFLVFW